MNDETIPEIDRFLSPDKIQPKADILESNLFKDLQVSKNNTYAEIEFTRKNKINSVIEKALQQFFFRFNIYPQILEAKLHDALMQDLSDNSEGIKLPLEIDDSVDVSFKRRLIIQVKQNDISIQIHGVPCEPEKNEAITRYYFDYSDYPGKLLPNGKFDFRELHKFPSVQKGDKLFFVRYSIPGKPGLSFDGKLIPVSEPDKLILEMLEGVTKKEIFAKNGLPVGFFVSAEKTGVVIMNKEDGQIRQIDVNDVIQLETIDFSIGNIGSELVSPVSMNIGTINNGFTISADGIVEVKNLDGGEVITKSDALIDQVRPGSKVLAKENVVVRTIADSFLQSDNATITIQSELRDSKLKAPKIIFKTTKGLIINNIIETCNFESNNLYFCGNNELHLGKHLFVQRKNLIDELDKLEKLYSDVKVAIEQIKENLLKDLKSLAVQIKDDHVLNMFKLLINTLQSFTFSDSFKVLDNLRSHMNVMQIDSVKKTFQSLEKLSKSLIEFNTKKTEVLDQLTLIERNINQIRFVLNGKINPTATIQIFCNKKNMDEPTLEIKPNDNEAISVSGRYNLKEGLVTN